MLAPSPFDGGPRKDHFMRRPGVRRFSAAAGAEGGPAYARGVRNGGGLRLGLAAMALATAVWGSLQLAASAASGRSSARVTIAFAGDIALLGPAPSSIFAGVRGQLRRADVAIGNLEGTLS